MVVPKPEEIVLVGMEKTPGHSDLRYAPQGDRKSWAAFARAMQLRVAKPLPRRDDVLSALNNCDIFHFAGHGLTDRSDPSLSSLLLIDGPLTVANLFETNLVQSHAASWPTYPPAERGRSSTTALIDEALHLISACQLSGFRHVIGTLWEVSDESCVKAATTTYEWMRRGSLSDESVAEGLHRASRHLRSLWISESAARSSKRAATARLEDGSKVMGELRPSQAAMNGPRTGELYEEPPPNWVPYIHFGI